MAFTMNPDAAPFIPGALAHVGGPALVAQGNAQAAPPAAGVIAYANRFNDKHLANPLTGSSAVDKGRWRDTNGYPTKWSTVFLDTYLEPIILAASVTKANGNHHHSITCHHAGETNFRLAQKNSKGSWKALPTSMFFCKICYTVSDVGGTRTVTLTHLETDF